MAAHSSHPHSIQATRRRHHEIFHSFKTFVVWMSSGLNCMMKGDHYVPQ